MTMFTKGLKSIIFKGDKKMNYFNFYYNTIDNKSFDDVIFTGEDDHKNFEEFIDYLKNNCEYVWADYGLNEKIVFDIPKKLQGKKFYNTVLKEYVVFSPDNQGPWGDFNVNRVVFTSNWGDDVKNAYEHIDKLMAEDLDNE